MSKASDSEPNKLHFGHPTHDPSLLLSPRTRRPMAPEPPINFIRLFKSSQKRSEAPFSCRQSIFSNIYFNKDQIFEPSSSVIFGAAKWEKTKKCIMLLRCRSTVRKCTCNACVDCFEFQSIKETVAHHCGPTRRRRSKFRRYLAVRRLHKQRGEAKGNVRRAKVFFRENGEGPIREKPRERDDLFEQT